MVISLSMLRPGPDPGGYYLSRQAGCPADYYLGAEPVGRWAGSGAADLGLTGRLDAAGEAALRSLLAGKGPAGQLLVDPVLRADLRGRLPIAPLLEAVRARANERGNAVETLFEDPVELALYDALVFRSGRARRGRSATVDPTKAARIARAAGLDVHAIYRDEDGTDRYATALTFAGKRVDVRRPGIDVTVSAPKSVSVLYALGDPDVAAKVRAAHQTAVGEALKYLESVAGHGLRGHQGGGQRAQRIATEGWIVAAFEHRTSRAGDPQLHTHLVVPNLVHGADGEWSALDSRAIHQHALTASYLYHAVLRGQLTRQLGLAWTTPEKGIAEIAGIPSGLLEVFSTRRRQILAALRDRGLSGAGAAQAACLATRTAKTTDQPEPTMREGWAGKARAAGHDRTRVVAAVLGRCRAPARPSIHQLAQHLLGPAGLTAHATGFDRRDLLQALCQALPPGLAVDRAQVEAAADEVLRHRDSIPLVSSAEHGRRWSTTELLSVEQAALRLANELRRAPPLAGVPLIETETRRAALSAEQQEMVRALAVAQGLAMVVGPAGAGKTAALAAAARAWADQGRPVTGAAVAAVTARRLEHATGIPATSLTRLLGTARQSSAGPKCAGGLAAGNVVVVDEASMVDTRTLATLLAHTRATGGTLVLVGDPAQLPEIGAGGMFAALTRHPATITLTDNRRQSEAWERRALADLRARGADAAVAAYAAHDRVHAAPADELADRIVDDYLHHLATTEADAPVDGNPVERVVMLAVRRADVTELNETARARLLAGGRLGPVAVTAGAGDRRREYRVGDRVLVTANDHRLGVLNGTRAAVTAVDARNDTLTLATHDQRQVTVPVDWAARHLDHGYAMTCHKAQGATVHTALLYGTAALTREAGYVAMSRGRTANHLYVSDDSDDTTATFDSEQHLDRLAARLSIRSTQTLASRQLPGAQPRPWQNSAKDHATRDRSEGISR